MLLCLALRIYTINMVQRLPHLHVQLFPITLCRMHKIHEKCLSWIHGAVTDPGYGPTRATWWQQSFLFSTPSGPIYKA